MENKPLEFSYDHARDVIEIEGINYSGALFRFLGGAFALNKPMMIIENKDKLLTVQQLTILENGKVEKEPIYDEERFTFVSIKELESLRHKIQNLNLNPDDILVVSSEDILSPEQILNIKSILEKQVGNKVLVLEEGLKLSKISKGKNETS